MNTSTATRPDDDTFETRLRVGLDHLAADTPVRPPGEFDPDELSLTVVDTARSRRLAPVLAAAAVTVITVGGLVAFATRDDSAAPAVQPPSPTPVASQSSPADAPPADDLAPAGAVVFDDVSDLLPGATFSGGGGPAPDRSGSLLPPDHVQRWYTSSMTQPELTPSILVESFPADRIGADVPAGAVPVSVQGVDAELYQHPVLAGRSVTFTLGDTTFVLTGTNIVDGDLLIAAGHVRSDPDGYGAVIAVEGLTNGLVERAAGTALETTFISREALGGASASISVESDVGTVWVRTLEEDAALLGLHRLGYETVTDVMVHDAPAFVTTLAHQPQYRGVSWHENGVTYIVGSNDLTTEMVVELANRLRSATLDEWNQLVNANPTDDADGEMQPVPQTTESMRGDADVTDG